MKKNLLFLWLLLIVTSCATQKTTIADTASVPIYYTGDDKPSASSGVVLYSDKHQ